MPLEKFQWFILSLSVVIGTSQVHSSPRFRSENLEMQF